MFKVNNERTRPRFKICSKLTIKTPQRRYWCRSGVFIVNFEHISHLFLVFLLLTLRVKIKAKISINKVITFKMIKFWFFIVTNQLCIQVRIRLNIANPQISNKRLGYQLIPFQAHLKFFRSILWCHNKIL